MKKITEKLFNRKMFFITIIIFLIVFSFFLGYKTKEMRDRRKETKTEDLIVQQRRELEMIKKDRGYIAPTEGEINLQLLELELLKEKAKENN
jgi:hypothetical protein